MKKSKLICAVDFDGTLCEHKFPSIGKANIELINALIEFKKNGHQVVLWTCRNGKYLEEAVEWCRLLGLEFNALNEDIPEIKNSGKDGFGGTKSCKVYADFYLDDRNCLLENYQKWI